MLYLFDMDGTLISSYMDNPDRNYHVWQLLPGRAGRIQQLIAAGHQIGIVSNQGGVAFGLISEQDVVQKLGQVAAQLGFASFWLHDGGQPMRAGWDSPALDCFVCYNDPRSKRAAYQDASRRKPSGAMICEAMAIFPEDVRSGVLMVGDRPEDEAAAQDAGVRFAWAEEFFGGSSDGSGRS